MLWVIEGDCETSERRQALESNQSFKTRRAKVESERRVLSCANFQAGSQIAVKVGFQVVCSVTTQTRPPTSVVIFDAPNSFFALCSFVAVVFFLDSDRCQKSKNMFALRSRSSPRQLPTWSPTFQMSRSPQLTIILQYS